MESKIKKYEKLISEKSSGEKSPVSPSLKPFKMRFHRILSSGSLKTRSMPPSPVSDKFPPVSRSSFNFETTSDGKTSSENSRPSSCDSSERSPLYKEAIFNRRQHQSNTTWHSPPSATGAPVVSSPERTQHQDRENNRLKGTTYDLFELLEKAQRSRLDDQRCVLPAYFNQTPSAQRQLSTSSDNGGDYSHHHHSHHRESRPLSHNNNNHGPKHPSPVPSTPPATAPASPHQLLAGQSRRTLQEILARPPPYPMVAIGARGGYWVDPPTQDTPTDGDSGGEGQSSGSCGAATWRAKIETDDTAKCYRRFFVGREHSTLISHDDQLGPVLLSIKPEHIAGQDHLRLLLRLRTGTMHELLPASCLGSASAAPARVARLLNEQLTCEHFTAALHPRASQLVAAYDEHVLVSQFKFGVLLQRKGQVTEEELFGNEGGTEEWENFLGLLGRRIRLKEHKGYRGGLDIHNGHTGDEAVYEVFREREIMFHVSTLLPYTDGDPQQLQRKRHIGNDIVAVVFQEDNTPFSPDMIASHFLHTFIVVQVLDKGTPERRYKVSVTARDDVPFFGPTLPTPAIFRHGPEFKEFLLTKLINAENACYKAEKFAKLELRTRASLLQTLTDDLKEKTAEFLGGSPSPVPGTPKSDSGPGSRFIDTVKKAWSSRVKSSQSVDHSLSTSASTTTVNGHEKLGKKTSQPIIAESTPSSTRSVSKSSLSSTSRPSPPASTPPSSPDLTAHAPPSRGAGGGGSDASSLASSSDGELIGDGGEAGEGAYPDSDTGLESMSSAETARGGGGGGCGRCGAGSGQSDGSSGSKALEGLVQEVTRLKCDKLDLLRQNVNCQRDIKRLREKELNLQGELAVATKEILRLRELLKDYSHGDKSPII